jgi:hypothetical protein
VVQVALDHTIEEAECCAARRQKVVGIVEVLARFGDDAVVVDSLAWTLRVYTLNIVATGEMNNTCVLHM